MNKCKVCKKSLRQKNKSGICSNCQGMRLAEAIKKGVCKLNEKDE